MGVINPALYDLPRMHRMEVTATCKDAIRSEVSVRDHSWTVDEPVAFGGTDLGGAPLEYALGSFAAVTNCMITLISEEMGIEVKVDRVHVAADLDTWGFLGKEAVGTPFPKLTLELDGESTATPAQLDTLKQAVQRRDPFNLMFAATGAEIVHDWRIREITAS